MLLSKRVITVEVPDDKFDETDDKFEEISDRLEELIESAMDRLMVDFDCVFKHIKDVPLTFKIEDM